MCLPEGRERGREHWEAFADRSPYEHVEEVPTALGGGDTTGLTPG
jgi:hypothetical protein